MSLNLCTKELLYSFLCRVKPLQQILLNRALRDLSSGAINLVKITFTYSYVQVMSFPMLWFLNSVLYLQILQSKCCKLKPKHSYLLSLYRSTALSLLWYLTDWDMTVLYYTPKWEKYQQEYDFTFCTISESLKLFSFSKVDIFFTSWGWLKYWLMMTHQASEID